MNWPKIRRKPKKFENNLPLFLTFLVKTSGRFFSNFVAFSQYLNFIETNIGFQYEVHKYI